MNKEIEPIDSNGDWHGYQEWYALYNRLWYRGMYKHGLEIGYEEYHKCDETNYYIK